MMTALGRVLIDLRFRVARAQTPTHSVGAAARRARTAVALGAMAFVLLTIGMEGAAETVKPEWRDPDYGQRLRQVRQWQRQRPDRPLVLVLGSSRGQFGVSPRAMNLPDGPGAPLVFNFGYCGAHPLGVWLQVARLLDAGVRPRAVLLMIAGNELRTDGSAEALYLRHVPWGPRLSAADARHLAPFTADPRAFEKELAAVRRKPWARGSAVLRDLVPHWQIPWDLVDPYGFAHVPAELVRTGQPARSDAAEVKGHARSLKLPIGDTSDRALRLSLSRVRDEGIPVALFWAPASPAYRAATDDPEVQRTHEEYARRLARDYGVAVFPAPEHLTNEDFADGYHLMPQGAAKYSRWLADNHLKPWLAEVLK